MHYINTEARQRIASNILETDLHIIDFRTTKKLPKPVFSLIIPVYQENKILESTLKLFSELLKNKYKFELIVSDGGSDDGTIKIAEKYADAVIVHNSERRQTIAEGRNNGATLAESDTLVFLNADTVPSSLEEFCEVITDFALQNNIFAVYDAMACYVSGFPDEVILKDKIFYKLHNAYVKLLNVLGLGMGRGECQVIRKSIFEQSGKYNNKIVAGEDFDLYKRVAKIGKIKFEKKLHVYESPRRFRKYGYIRTISYWLLNSLSVMIFKKSYSKEWEAVR